MQQNLLDVRDELKRIGRSGAPLVPEDLHEMDANTRKYYFDAANRVINPPLPAFQNTDGNPLEPVTLRYK